MINRQKGMGASIIQCNTSLISDQVTGRVLLVDARFASLASHLQTATFHSTVLFPDEN
jgi:hypothetical protein